VAPNPLAHLILALAIDNGHPGRSPYSFEAVTECGTDKAHPTCTIEPFCSDNRPSCRAPRWSQVRSAFVRMETRDGALRRFARISNSLAATATRLAECRTLSGDPIRDCKPVEWGGTTRTLALSALTVVLHESGLREDVQFGHPPLGRGPAGEACLMQLAPDQAIANASWLTEEERTRYASKPRERERFVRSLLGSSPEALNRCFDVGVRMLARARRSCESSGAWDFGMFSMYGGGRSCRVPNIGKTRTRTLHTLSLKQPTHDPELDELLASSAN